MSKVIDADTIKKINILDRLFHNHTAIANACQLNIDTVQKYVTPKANIEIDIAFVQDEAVIILKSYAFKKAIKGEKGADVCYRMAKDLEKKTLTVEKVGKNYHNVKLEMDKL